MFHFLLLISRQGKVRLAKWLEPYSQKERTKISQELASLVIARSSKMCNFIEWRDIKVVYKRYASLFFVAGIDSTDNELITLEIIHHYVECLDKYFGNVCELDLIFNFSKAYYILDEILLAGELQESKRGNVLRAIQASDSMAEKHPEDPKHSQLVVGEMTTTRGREDEIDYAKVIGFCTSSSSNSAKTMKERPTTAFVCGVNDLWCHNFVKQQLGRKRRTPNGNRCQRLSCVLQSNPFFQKLSLIKSLENSLDKIWKGSETSALEKQWKEQRERMDYIQCSSCKAVYTVKANMFGEKGRYVRCIVCGKLWLQLPQDVRQLEEDMETKELSQEDWEQWKLVRMKKMNSSRTASTE